MQHNYNVEGWGGEYGSRLHVALLVDQKNVVWKFTYKLHDANYFGYVCKHLHVHPCMGEHEHSVFGKHMKDEHNVRPGNS